MKHVDSLTITLDFRSNSWSDPCEDALGPYYYSPSNTVSHVGSTHSNQQMSPIVHIKDLFIPEEQHSSSAMSLSSNVSARSSSPNSVSAMTSSLAENDNKLLDSELMQSYHEITGTFYEMIMQCYIHLFSVYSGVYAEQLYIWGLWHQRIRVIKRSFNASAKANNLPTSTEDDEVIFPMASHCLKCEAEDNLTLKCSGCSYPSLTCAICDLPVRGLVSACERCAHAGHMKHVKLWFKRHKKCPVLECDCFCTR